MNNLRVTIALILCVFLAQSCKMKKALVVGHRGAMGHETENTLASIQKAMDMNVDMIEIDVFKIKTGEIVVFHDDTVERLTDGKGEIESYTLYDLKKLNVSGGHKIPALQEVLDLMDGKTLLNIELKGAGTTKDVNALIETYIETGKWEMGDFIISSFKWDELRAMRKINPKIPIAVLTSENPINAIPVGKELAAEAINPNFKTLTPQNSLALKEAGFKIYTWTVNEPQDILRMKRLGVDAIITNYPERIE